MMYSEFLEGTNAPQTRETYDQFLELEKIYTSNDSLKKEDIYKMWLVEHKKPTVNRSYDDLHNRSQAEKKRAHAAALKRAAEAEKGAKADRIAEEQRCLVSVNNQDIKALEKQARTKLKKTFTTVSAASFAEATDTEKAEIIYCYALRSTMGVYKIKLASGKSVENDVQSSRVSSSYHRLEAQIYYACLKAVIDGFSNTDAVTRLMDINIDAYDVVATAAYGAYEALAAGETVEEMIFKALREAVNKYVYSIGNKRGGYHISYMEDINGDIVNVNNEIDALFKDTDTDTETRKAIKDILNALTPKQKTVLKYKVKGYSQRQIAQKMNKTQRSVLKYLRTIRKEASEMYPDLAAKYR